MPQIPQQIPGVPGGQLPDVPLPGGQLPQVPGVPGMTPPAIPQVPVPQVPVPQMPGNIPIPGPPPFPPAPPREAKGGGDDALIPVVGLAGLALALL